MRSFLLAASCLVGLVSAYPPHQRRQDPYTKVKSSGPVELVPGLWDPKHADGSTDNNIVIQKILWSLNSLRYEHDAPPVYWNTTLWEYATEYASQCINAHSKGPYAETMGSGSQNAAFDMNTFEEEAIWNGQVPANDHEFMDSGHFFIEMWKAVEYIGCARVWCDSLTSSSSPTESNWLSVCVYSHSANRDPEDFTENISQRVNDGPPEDWNPPENYVNYQESEFPPIVSPAKAWPDEVDGEDVPQLKPTIVGLPPGVEATAEGKEYTESATDSNTNPIVGPTAVPAPGALRDAGDVAGYGDVSAGGGDVGSDQDEEKNEPSTTKVPKPSTTPAQEPEKPTTTNPQQSENTATAPVAVETPQSGYGSDEIEEEEVKPSITQAADKPPSVIEAAEMPEMETIEDIVFETVMVFTTVWV